MYLNQFVAAVDFLPFLTILAGGVCHLLDMEAVRAYHLLFHRSAMAFRALTQTTPTSFSSSFSIPWVSR